MEAAGLTIKVDPHMQRVPRSQRLNSIHSSSLILSVLLFVPSFSLSFLRIAVLCAALLPFLKLDTQERAEEENECLTRVRRVQKRGEWREAVTRRG